MMEEEKRIWPGEELLTEFADMLVREERSRGTIEKYVRDVKHFGRWLAENSLEVSRETGTAWREALLEQGYQPVTVNSMVCAVNTFFRLTGVEGLQIKTLRLQRKLFQEEERNLSKGEFQRLLRQAEGEGNQRLAMILETIAGTGIRISELSYITAEAVKTGRAAIRLKGKVRTILLPARLCQKLKLYMKKRGVHTGVIFLTGRGKAICRKQVWAEMKALAVRAGVETGKVFPHNLRHLFARCFYKENRDLAGLASLLGHSSIETTRIYLLSTEASKQKQLGRMRLVC